MNGIVFISKNSPSMTDRGGIYRAGTGSAMFYIKFSKNFPATADGRRYGEAIAKTALLVKSYINLGGHQLQLNAVNLDRLIEARRNPQDYRNLIVRVWGWSGYFTELDKEYQDHIISRCEYTM